MPTDFHHISVLKDEAIRFLLGDGEHRSSSASVGCTAVNRYIDATVGGGGDSEAILAAAPANILLGIDRDRRALAAAAARLEPFEGRFNTWHGRFSEMERAAAETGWTGKVDGILMDIGVSSPQIDNAERGFSFRQDAPLDMRMDQNSSEATAADLLNTLPEEQLAEIFWKYGEERFSRPIAAAIVRRRQERPWARTGELAELLNGVIGWKHQHGLPPPTRVFQALRIAVNRELEELTNALSAAERLLAPGGRLVVISFHSLEDRIVKQFLQHAMLSCTCPPGMPCTCHKQVTFQALTRKPVTATPEELAANPRSSCAKLRAAVRTEAPPEAQ